MDGFTVAEEIRDINPDVPLFFLSAKTMKDDIIPVSYTHLDVYKRQGMYCNFTKDEKVACSFLLFFVGRFAHRIRVSPGENSYQSSVG